MTSWQRQLRARLRRRAPQLGSLLTGAYDRLLDGVDLVRGRRDALIPPRALLRISTDPSLDFRETGRSLVRFLGAECGLTHEAAVLDVGCGVGRLAVALTGWLQGTGRYEGLDVAPQEIEWCRRHITPRFPRFTFRLADIRSQSYHPAGTTPAADYVFPYPPDTFDMVVAASVFTHLLTQETSTYLAEIARVLKPGGRCLASFYLMNDEARRGIAAGTAAFAFRYRRDECHVENDDIPDLAVSHDEAGVGRMAELRDLAIDRLWYGGWRSTRQQDQDLLLFRRRAAPGATL